jgi:hypothetical protein
MCAAFSFRQIISHPALRCQIRLSSFQRNKIAPMKGEAISICYNILYNEMDNIQHSLSYSIPVFTPGIPSANAQKGRICRKIRR